MNAPVIGRAIARLPVADRAEIRRTPLLGAPDEDVYELIANVDRVYFLMGEDITAPAGMEWLIAWKLERSVFPLRRGNRRTPAAQEFLRGIPIQWQMFHNSSDLARIITLDMARILNHPKNRYGLTLTELNSSTSMRRQSSSEDYRCRVRQAAHRAEECCSTSVIRPANRWGVAFRVNCSYVTQFVKL